jgi:hypothetical protein
VHPAADSPRSLVTPRFLVRVVAALVTHPSLWPAACRQWARMVARGWWRRPPFLPLPDGDYLRFRLETQYGRAMPVDPVDVVVYLRWCRDFGR